MCNLVGEIILLILLSNKDSFFNLSDEAGRMKTFLSLYENLNNCCEGNKLKFDRLKTGDIIYPDTYISINPILNPRGKENPKTVFECSIDKNQEQPKELRIDNSLYIKYDSNRLIFILDGYVEYFHSSQIMIKNGDRVLVKDLLSTDSVCKVKEVNSIVMASKLTELQKKKLNLFIGNVITKWIEGNREYNIDKDGNIYWLIPKTKVKFYNE